MITNNCLLNDYLSMKKQAQSTKHKLKRSYAVSYSHHTRYFSNTHRVTDKGGMHVVCTCVSYSCTKSFIIRKLLANLKYIILLLRFVFLSF